LRLIARRGRAQYGLGNVFFWRALSIGGGIAGILCVLTSLMVVESPRWLAGRVGMGEAELSLRALRQPHCDIQGTLREIRSNVAAIARQRDQKLSTQTRQSMSLEKSRASSSPGGNAAFVSVLLATMLMSAVPISGVLAVFSFAGEILAEIFPTHRNLASIVIPVAGTAGVLCVTQGADRLGRKPVSDVATTPLFCVTSGNLCVG
jgi:hypothetical protein